MNGFAGAVDRTLELAVVPSFTRIGYRVRSRLDHWTRLDQYDLTDRVVVITGATSGLGLAAYARAKRAQMMLAQMWAEQLRPDRITVHAMHPGCLGRHTRR
jgi:hypothetical protein